MKFLSLLLYNLILWFYHTGLRIAAFFHPKAKKWVNGRKDWEANLTNKLTFSRQPIWIHCASLGEFEQGRPLIEAIKKQQPDTKILLTFYSPSGYEIRQNYPLVDAVIYLPPDSRKNAQKFLKIVNPKMAIFVKYEFWFHYLYTLKKEQIPTYLISAIFRKSQPFFKWYGGLHRDMLGCFEYIFLQEKGSYELLENVFTPAPKGEQDSKKEHLSDNHTSLGIAGNTRFSITGDTRIDRVMSIQAEKKVLPIIEQFCKNHQNILVCGSTWEADENLLLPIINNSFSNGYKTIIAPHEINKSHISAIQKRLTVPNVTYSLAQISGIGEAQVLIIDNIGLLAHLYRFGKIAYIGGGFGSGIHNTLEPIAFGLPVIFGKKFKKFQEAVTLIENGGAFSINNEVELKAVFDKLTQENFYQNASGKALKYLRENRGATSRILQKIL